MRFNSDDTEGKALLSYFIDNEPIRLLHATSTAWHRRDAKRDKLIVLDQNINSMTEFKQIIGAEHVFARIINNYIYDYGISKEPLAFLRTQNLTVIRW